MAVAVVAVVASCTIDQLDSFRTEIRNAKTIMHSNVHLFKASHFTKNAIWAFTSS